MKNTVALWMSLLVGTFGSKGFAADSQKVIDIQKIQGKLSQMHANWRAKESWVTRLSKDEIRKMLGLQRPPKGSLDFQSIPGTQSHAIFSSSQRNSAMRSSAPTSLDWRSFNGVDWLGPMMNQGNCGSCVAFAVVATLEAQTSISTGIPWLHPSYSPQELFSCGGGGCNSGWEPGDAANFLQNTGVSDEACMPYSSGSTGQDVSCSDKCADADTRSVKIASFNTPTSGGGSVDSVKAALKNGPLVTTLTVYDDFLTYAEGVYQHVTGDAEGGHAVSIVGYDDSKRAWLIRNSWGQEWGENGFAWVSWDDDSGFGAETWGYELPLAQGQISVSSPSDLAYVSGTIHLSTQSKGLDGQKIQFHVKDAGGRNVNTFTCVADAGNCSTALDTTALKEGRYEISAVSSSSVSSQIREFYVINSEPKMSLSFVPVDGVDLTAPLNGRPEFDITATFSPVPIQHVEFRAIDDNGKIASVKGNDYVLEQMRMGWRTIGVPDGHYTILFHGETTYNGKVYAVDSNSYSIHVKN